MNPSIVGVQREWWEGNEQKKSLFLLQQPYNKDKALRNKIHIKGATQTTFLLLFLVSLVKTNNNIIDIVIGE